MDLLLDISFRLIWLMRYLVKYHRFDFGIDLRTIHMLQLAVVGGCLGVVLIWFNKGGGSD
uniref:F-box family protein n=1 Tax=Solanum tuberosum TaxID=4113 RepID=M0ZYW0_SOLTU